MRIISFSQKIFLSVITLFIAFVACFLLFQNKREKTYKTELLKAQLQNYNDQIYGYLSDNNAIDSLYIYLNKHMLPELRVTIIGKDGNVIFDSTHKDINKFSNHASRKEIKDAVIHNKGYDIRRRSESIDGLQYFYSAKYYPSTDIVIRSALPYDINLTEHLKADSQYLWFTISIFIILIVILYRLTFRLGKSTTNLQQFAIKADKNEPIDLEILKTFPKNELGEISQHIIKIYKRLHRAKEALYIEREKLISHLQITHEGLGIFTKERNEILVNNLFTQYINNISDNNLSSSDEIFSIPELQPIADFLNRNKDNYTKEEKKLCIQLNKNARNFIIECIIFQDFSFEISIIDNTKEEEQARLKRQLTQNIAHELKTPVSSIQGYIETILNNPDIPEKTMKTFLERSYAQSTRLSTLLHDISVLSRMDEAPEMVERECVDISQMVGNIINEVTLGLEQKNIKVNNLLSDEITINGSYSLVYSIFRNLMDNAIAYAGTDISITINSFRESEDFYYFSFSDTGSGIEDKHLSRLFERFYRVDKGRSRKLGGTGLGLAIVKNAVMFHKGSIFAKNSPNGGLEFIFSLHK